MFVFASSAPWYLPMPLASHIPASAAAPAPSAVPVPSVAPVASTPAAPSGSAATLTSPSGAPLDAPSLHDCGLALFRLVFNLALTIVGSLANTFRTDEAPQSPMLSCKVIECLYRLVCIQLTLDFFPNRITPRQLLALARAARAIERLSGQSFDFTPWTSLSPSELDRISPLSTPQPAAGIPDSSNCASTSSQKSPADLLQSLSVSSVRSCTPSRAPGSALAQVCRTLARLVSALPAESSPALPAPAQPSSPQSESAFPIPFTRPCSSVPVGVRPSPSVSGGAVPASPP